MISQVLDLTVDFNANNLVQLDIGGWQTCSIQAVGPSGTITIQGSNDGGEVTGSVSESPTTAINFGIIQATKLSDGTSVTAIAAAGVFAINVINCKYLSIGGASAAATKLLVFLTKPY